MNYPLPTLSPTGSKVSPPRSRSRLHTIVWIAFAALMLVLLIVQEARHAETKRAAAAFAAGHAQLQSDSEQFKHALQALRAEIGRARAARESRDFGPELDRLELRVQEIQRRSADLLREGGNR